MQNEFNCSGVYAPIVTPIGDDGAIDQAKFIEHAEWCLAEGCSGLVPFGTTSEANSFGLDERLEAMEDLVDAGIDPNVLMPGTGACSIADAVIMTQHAVDLDCAGVMVLPPFYYKNPSEEGLFRFFAEVIEGVGDDRLKLYLYHIPPQAVVGFPLSLIERLVEEFPGVVVGLKDSSGDWNNMKMILDAKFPGFELFPGSEAFMLDALRLGAAGCISANANTIPRRLRDLYDGWQGDNADVMQADIVAYRKASGAYPMIPSIKGLISHFREDPSWARVKPPMVEMSKIDIEAAAKKLAAENGLKMTFPMDV